MYCKHCGNKLSDDEKFCGQCGNPIDRKNEKNKPSDSGVADKEEKHQEIKDSSTSAVVITVFVIGGLILMFWAIFYFSSSENQNTGISTTASSTDQQSTAPSQQSAISTENVNQPQSNLSQITPADIAPYLTGVMEVICSRTNADGKLVGDTGSGSLWKLQNGDYDIVTNMHVIAGNDSCGLFNTDIGVYNLDLSQTSSWNKLSDEAVIPIVPPTGNTQNLTPISELNYSISSLQDCPSAMPQDSPVIVVGYPAYSAMLGVYNPENAIENEITTNGTISGYDSSPQNDGLPYSNYYISATIDSGNSGGIAFSKDKNGLCLLGIPTWITTTGNYSNEGIVQNIDNITWVANK